MRNKTGIENCSVMNDIVQRASFLVDAEHVKREEP